jgi:Fic family protein
MWNLDLTYRTDFQSTFERLYQKRQDLQNSRPLPNIALNKIRESLSLEWTYNSNSIEGNTMSLRETQMVIQEGITIKGKSLR